MDLPSHRKVLLERALTSKRSSFYRDFYRERGADTEGAWESLPALSKADIARVPYRERLFVPEEQIAFVRLTSGTSASGILAIPRIAMRHTAAESSLMPVSRYIGFMLPHKIYDNFAAEGSLCIGGDPARLPYSAALAAAIDIEGIAATAAVLIAFAPHLGERYDRSQIRHLMLHGDACTKLQEAALRRLYPSASLIATYTSCELQGLSAASREDDLGIFRGHPLVHYEIVNDEGAAITEPERDGELIVSTLLPDIAFPLIRYRTGDRARFVGSSKREFRISGRLDDDRVPFDAGVLLPEAIEAAIDQSTDAVADFEASVIESDVSGRLVIALTIALRLVDADDALDTTAIAREIETRLKIGDERTYREAIEHGSCAPITCTIAGHAGAGKRRRLQDLRAR